MALEVKIRQITPLHPTKIFVQWDVLNPTENGSYTFLIQRSGSIDGPWENIATGVQNTYNYIDDLLDQPELPADGKAHLFSLQRQIYYRITVVPPSGCVNQAVSEPEGLYKVELGQDPAGLVAAGLRRKQRYEETILFKRLNGVRLVVLKRRFWGVRCPECYDPTTRATTKEHCTTCYGTGFTDGYWDPVLTWGRVYPPDNISVQTTPKDKKEASQHLITLLDVPLLQDLDLVVEVDTNQRHQVRLKKQTELRRKSVHQQVTTSLIDRGSIEYEIPVDARSTPPLL